LRAYAYSTAQNLDINEKILLEAKLPDSDLVEIAREIEQGELILNGHSIIPAIQGAGYKQKKQKPFQRKAKRIAPENRK
jgi:hypothetical protein